MLNNFVIPQMRITFATWFWFCRRQMYEIRQKHQNKLLCKKVKKYGRGQERRGPASGDANQ